MTGATGGLGELVVNRLLTLGVEVIATSRNEEKARTMGFYSRVIYKPFDISQKTDKDLFRYFNEPDVLIHLAWEKLNEYRNEEHLTTILDNHKAFIANLLQNGLKDLTAVGTCYEYGLREGVLDESMPADPVLPYPQAKNLFREFIESQKNTRDFSFKWLRVFYVFGEVKERKNLYTLILNAVKNGEETFNMSGGEQVRDFLTPHEIANIIVDVSLQKSTEGVINCCSGKPVKLKDFVTEFLKNNNFKLKLNLGYYPYVDYEPMITWGSVEKLKQVIRN